MLLAKIRGVSGIFCTLNDKIDDGVLEAAGNLFVIIYVLGVTVGQR